MRIISPSTDHRTDVRISIVSCTLADQLINAYDGTNNSNSTAIFCRLLRTEQEGIKSATTTLRSRRSSVGIVTEVGDGQPNNRVLTSRWDEDEVIRIWGFFL